MASPSASSEPPWHAVGHQETAWNLGVLQNLEKRPSAHLMCGVDKVCAHQSVQRFRKPGQFCDLCCISHEKSSLLMENCFINLFMFWGKGDDPVVLCIAYMSGWSSRGGFYTEERQFYACSSWHTGASAPPAGNSNLTRIHLQHLVCKHSDGFIRLNLWCQRHLAFLVCAWTSHLKTTDTYCSAW